VSILSGLLFVLLAGASFVFSWFLAFVGIDARPLAFAQVIPLALGCYLMLGPLFVGRRALTIAARVGFGWAVIWMLVLASRGFGYGYLLQLAPLILLSLGAAFSSLWARRLLAPTPPPE
jgi:hypothetical protein